MKKKKIAICWDPLPLVHLSLQYKQISGTIKGTQLMAMIIKMCFIITITRLIDLLFVLLQSLQIFTPGRYWLDVLLILIVIVLISNRVLATSLTHLQVTQTSL